MPFVSLSPTIIACLDVSVAYLHPPMTLCDLMTMQSNQLQQACCTFMPCDVLCCCMYRPSESCHYTLYDYQAHQTRCYRCDFEKRDFDQHAELHLLHQEAALSVRCCCQHCPAKAREQQVSLQFVEMTAASQCSCRCSEQMLHAYRRRSCPRTSS